MLCKKRGISLSVTSCYIAVGANMTIFSVTYFLNDPVQGHKSFCLSKGDHTSTNGLIFF